MRKERSEKMDGGNRGDEEESGEEERRQVNRRKKIMKIMNKGRGERGEWSKKGAE